MGPTSQIDARAFSPGAAQPQAPCVEVAPDDARPGWHYVTAYDHDDAWAAASLIAGAHPRGDALYVPEDAVQARPDLFRARPHAIETPEVPDAIGGLPLRPYQREGIAFLMREPGAVLHGDLGTGKTLQATVAVKLTGYRRVLVLGPLISQGSWVGPRSDPTRYLGIDVEPLAGVQAIDLRREPPPSGWVFCHYDIFEAWQPWLDTHFQPEVVIFDEVQELRKPRTRRSRLVRGFVQLHSIRLRIVLSGTLVVNSLLDLWAPLYCARPGAFGSWVEFIVRYFGATRGEHGWQIGTPTNVAELNARLAHLILRHDRHQVQRDLPSVSYKTVDVQLDAAALDDYHAAARDIRRYLRAAVDDAAAQAGGERLVQISKLFSILAAAKVPRTLEVVQDAVASVGKVVLFTWHKATATALARALARDADLALQVFGPSTGETPVAVRNRRAADFRAHQGRAVFVATLGACSMAMNDLVAACVCVFNEIHWEPVTLVQALGRLWRTGQTAPVTAIFVRATGTIEDQMLQKLEAKAAAIEAGGGGREAGGLVAELAGRLDERRRAVDDLVAELMALDATHEAAA